MSFGIYTIRSGTTTQWATPTRGLPRAGELIWNETAGHLKRGDGTSAESALPALNVPSGPRVSVLSNVTTVTVNSDNFDSVVDTGITGAITVSAPTGTPTEDRKLKYAFVGTASRAITWNSTFEASTIPLPTTTSGTSRLDVGFVWRSDTSKWHLIGVA